MKLTHLAVSSRITKRWEGDDEHVVSSTQSGSTGPEQIGEGEIDADSEFGAAADLLSIAEGAKKLSFTEQVMGKTKVVSLS